MDMKVFTEKLLHSEELKNVPAEYIFQVAFFILELLKDKDNFFETPGGI